MMSETNKLNLAAPWPEVKERMKESNIELTDEDLSHGPEKADALLAHLASKMNRSPEDIRVWIESLSSNKGKAS